MIREFGEINIGIYFFIQLGIFLKEARLAPIFVAREIRSLASYRLLKYLESRDEV